MYIAKITLSNGDCLYVDDNLHKLTPVSGLAYRFNDRFQCYKYGLKLAKTRRNWIKLETVHI